MVIEDPTDEQINAITDRMHNAVESIALEDNLQAREKTLEGYEEHNVVKNLLKDMSSFPKDNERWLPKVNVLKEIVERHMEAEESKLFRQVRRDLGKDRAEELAMRFEERKMRRKAA